MVGVHWPPSLRNTQIEEIMVGSRIIIIIMPCTSHLYLRFYEDEMFGGGSN